MKTVEYYNDPELAKQCNIEYRTSDNKVIKIKKTVAVENPLDVYINDIPMVRLVCSPSLLEELISGYLYTSGIIENIDEIIDITICENRATASVYLNSNRKQPATSIDRQKKGSCCRSLSEALPLKRLPKHTWNYEDILSLSKAFLSGLPLYTETKGVHSCILSVGKNILYKCEDISRHNALDKAIGCALKDRIDMSGAILFKSGRTPVDIITKVIRSGIPVLAFSSVPTEQAIKTACQCNLTLLGCVDAGVCIYSG